MIGLPCESKLAAVPLPESKNWNTQGTSITRHCRCLWHGVSMLAPTLLSCKLVPPILCQISQKTPTLARMRLQGMGKVKGMSNLLRLIGIGSVRAAPGLMATPAPLRPSAFEAVQDMLCNGCPQRALKETRHRRARAATAALSEPASLNSLLPLELCLVTLV